METKSILGHGKKTGIQSEFKNGIYHLTIFDASNPKKKLTFKLHSKNTTTPKEIRTGITTTHSGLAQL